MPRLSPMLAALFLAATIAQGARAGPLEDGMEAYNEKDYIKAIQLWRPLAESGNALAAFRLGSMYAEGHGVVQDDATAFQWFMRGAQKGEPQAQYAVGASYIGGDGVKKDNVEAAKWFRRAANQGMPYAQLNLGLLHASGAGVPKDNVEAFKWLELALIGLPPGGARSDVARAMTDVAAGLTPEEVAEARARARRFKAVAEGM